MTQAQDKQSQLEPGAEFIGLIVRNYGLYFDVEVKSLPGEVLRCTLRGLLKRERRRTDVAAVGDRVRATLTTPDMNPPEGVIEEVLPRERVLSRLARGRDDVEQVIVANPDQLVAVFSLRDPRPNPRMIERFLLIAEARGLASAICVNKVDLVATHELEEQIESLFGPFRFAGYPVIEASARTGEGMDELYAILDGKISAFAGPSGVGKSSLLNALVPERQERVGEISSATGKGRHTTTWTTLFRIAPNTYVADTPGIRSLRPWGVNFDELDRLFPEFRPYLDTCYYADCRHLDEPGCAVREALEAGAIHPERYATYRAFLGGDDVDV